MYGVQHGKHGKGRPRTCYISQVIKDNFKQLKNKAQERESKREHLL